MPSSAQLQRQVTERELNAFARECRILFERMLESSVGHRDATGSCLYAAIFTAECVSRFKAWTPCIRGGYGDGDGGFRERSGVMRGHYWTEVCDRASGEVWVVDITSDQFDGPPVVVLPLSGSTGTYLPGDQAEIDEHVRTELQLISPAARSESERRVPPP